MSETAIEKMVEWLENNEDEIDGGVAFDMIYEKAARLASLEAKPPANADLVVELKRCLDHAHPSVYGSECDEYWWKGYDKKEEDIKEILSRYSKEAK